MSECIFCRIVAGELDSFTVYEDEFVKAFLDVNPIEEGHTLVIPKQHVVDLTDIPESVLQHCVGVAQKLALRYKPRLNASGFNLLHSTGRSAGQEVFHFHLHLVPRHGGDGSRPEFDGSPADEQDLKKVFEKVKP